jgi:hypothetical protein
MIEYENIQRKADVIEWVGSSFKEQAGCLLLVGDSLDYNISVLVYCEWKKGNEGCNDCFGYLLMMRPCTSGLGGGRTL